MADVDPDAHRAACRAGELRWRGMPRGIPPDMAIDFMNRLEAGSTVRKLTSGLYGPAIVSYDRFRKHCTLHPAWASKAWRISKVNGNASKGERHRSLTHCMHGHSLADATISYQAGYIKRSCKTCWKIRQKHASPIDPTIAKKVEVLLRRGASISSFTKGGSKGYLLEHKTFTRFRLENTEINGLFLTNLKDANSRAQRLRHLRVKNERRRTEANDYHQIVGMVPESFPDRDSVVSRIFEDMLSGILKREDVRARVKFYITEHYRMFPTNFAKFGSAKLVSLDEVMFDNGSMTRGDTISRGLWE
jgi:hypothetical protein